MVVVEVVPSEPGTHGGRYPPVRRLRAKAGPTGNVEIPMNQAFAAMVASAGKARRWCHGRGGRGGVGGGGSWRARALHRTIFIAFANFARKLDPRGTQISPRPHSLRWQRTQAGPGGSRDRSPED